MGTRVFSHAFSAGEITPEMFGRIDTPKRQEGLALCSNFITLPYGPAINRPGTLFVKEVKNSSSFTRLIPFSYSNTQTFAIEVGAGYFRFHTLGETLLYTTPAAWSSTTAYNIGDLTSYGGVNYYCTTANTNVTPPNASYWYALPTDMTYEIPNPYAAADLMDIHFTQSADVITLVHQNYAPLELRRYGATNWQISYPNFNPPSSTITSISATATVVTSGGTPVTESYVVTNVLAVGLQESAQYSGVASCTNDLTLANNHNTISWTDSAAAGTNVRYNVYKLSNGIYGYIGQSGSTSFVDNNITADITNTPPLFDSIFQSANNYPAAVGYYQQRRVFAGTFDEPQNVWMTRSGTESDMGYTIPTRSDNRVAFRIAAREASAVRHIVPVRTLLLLSATTEFQVSAPSTGVLSPTDLSVDPQSYVGANMVQPVVVNNWVLFAAARGGHLREMSYNYMVQGYLTGDVSLFASHLFDYYQITDMAYVQTPYPIVWCVSSSGKLLGMTYIPEQEVAGWHQHSTGVSDIFESICTVTENNNDVLYCIVNRTINGVQKRYVEVFASRDYTALANAYFVDCGATYTNTTPVTTISGLTWLEGMTVNILADGAVVPQQVVTNGTITLPVAASVVNVGLPIVAQMETPPAAQQMDPAYMQGREKNVNKVFIRTYRSSGIYAGPSFDNLTQYAQRSNEPYGSPPNMVSDEIEIVLNPQWSMSGQVCIEQLDPLPLDVVSIALEIAVGGGI